MKSIRKKFSVICKTRYAPYKFCQIGKTFARIYNDTLQTFSLKEYEHQNAMTVEFSVIPLCMQLPVFPNGLEFYVLNMGSYELDHFDVDNCIDLGWRRADSNLNENDDNYVLRIVKAVDRYLIPFFERCTNCEKALFEVIELEKLFERNRIKALSIMGLNDCAKPFAERVLFDSKKYYMAIKAKNFEYARRYLIYQMNYYKTELQTLEKGNITKQADIVRQKYTDKIIWIEEQFAQLENGNIVYFDDLIKDNEAIMHKFLAENFPHLQEKIGDGSLS